jgi:protein TonB
MAAYLSWIRDDAKKPAKDEPAPVRAEGSIQPPKAIKTLNPAYPEGARAAGVQGFVSLETETDPAGKVRRIQSLVFKEEPGLSGMNSVPLIKAAIDAVKQWVYEPLIVDGKPRAAIFTVTVRFTLK